MNDDHSKYHSKNAFCGYASPEEMQHLQDLVNELSDDELKNLVKSVGIGMDFEDVERWQFEGIIEEADKEDFYREYKRIIKLREIET